MMPVKKNQTTLQFKITLLYTDPPIWRRIQVPATYSFWDLHVAIQDAMGWLDYHLHAFRFGERGKEPIEIGIPDPYFNETDILAGWEVAITNFFEGPGDTALYEYDFGDGWSHEILLEGILLKETRTQYPRCIAGERACPPEDCGGVPGYYHLLEILRDPTHDEHEEMTRWLQRHAKDYHPYDPDTFDRREVTFDDPGERWQNAFSGR